MYSNKENINTLTSLLVAHGVGHAVVCPGSRNAPIVHNLNECSQMVCHAVTDERSAGFYALGMAQMLGCPVAVCVTSGTALLNLAPAVAEAYYQHLPLVVVSADRPASWIDQLDGQTLPQADALGRFVKCAVSLPEPTDADSRWHCNRLVNEALLACRRQGGGPVHINVPITEPLFVFSCEALSTERKIDSVSVCSRLDVSPLMKILSEAVRPMIVIGQMSPDAFDAAVLALLEQQFVVIKEPLSPTDGVVIPFDGVLADVGDEVAYYPDVILYFGDTLVSKRIKKFLRKAAAPTYLVTADGDVHDTFMHLAGIIETDRPGEVLEYIAEEIGVNDNDDTDAFELFADPHMAFRLLWAKALSDKRNAVDTIEADYSQMSAVKCFEDRLLSVNYPYQVHYANSTSVRLANLFAHHYVWCNRGVNGIEGSLSTAAGMSVVSEDMIFCVIGDLSFFYDQNALWNAGLAGNLRIILLNNGGGGIFSHLPGLENSPARNEFVSACHHTDAHGICEQNNIGYLRATNQTEMCQCIDMLLTSETDRPMVLEIDLKTIKEIKN